jgi:hypothetical protein
MDRHCGTSRRGWYSLLALLLLTAQSFALTHVYEHEFGTPATQTCEGCVSASQLSPACTDNYWPDVFLPQNSGSDAVLASEYGFGELLVVRLRGPPASP